MRITSDTKQGASRPVNEDYVALHEKDGIMILADGMGGKDAGELASKTVAEEILSCSITKRLEYPEPGILLTKSLLQADESLGKINFESRLRSGATVLAGIIHDNVLTYTWQGNVRAYIFSGGKWASLTSDHIMDIGYGRQRITRCLKGQGLREDLPVNSRNLAPGDVILMCTDGFYECFETGMPDPHVIPDLFTTLTPTDDASYILCHL